MMTVLTIRFVFTYLHVNVDELPKRRCNQHHLQQWAQECVERDIKETFAPAPAVPMMTPRVADRAQSSLSI